MRGSDRYVSSALARRPRRATRAFRPEWSGSGLEIRLLPAITLSPLTLPNDTLGHPYDETVVASGGTGGYTYAVTTGTLPDGLSLNSTTGAIAGTPTTVTTSNFTITATDSSNDTGSQAYSITINPAITFITTTLPPTTVNIAYSQQLATSGGTGTTTYTVTAGALPAGLTLSNTGLISGTPTSVGVSTFTVTATDTVGATGNQSYSETINPAITFTTTTLPDTTVNVAYNQQLITNGGTGTITFAVTAGTLPAGLTLSSSGQLSGTPTTAGTSNFTVTATDTVGATKTQSYNETINPAIAFTTTTLPAATLSKAYSQQLVTTGGTGALTFAVTTGTLPAGLTLSSTGLLSGTPTSAGSSSFTITATDTVSATAAQAYTFLVNPAIAFTTTSLPNTTVGAGYSQQIATTGGTGTLTFAITTGTLPAGLTLSSSGLISGTATATGQSTFTVTATDTNNASTSQSYTINVNPAITFTTTTLPAATAGTAYSQQISATGGTGTLTFAVTTGTLPAGLSLSSSGLITGTATTAGNSTFTVTASDTAGGTTNQDFTITVNGSSVTTGPTVTSLQRFGFHAQPTIFVLTFSTALDPTPAQDISNYNLVPLVNGVAGTPIKLSSAVYDSSTNTVTLTPTHNVYLYAQYQLTVNGTSPSGLTDTSGNFLAGSNGQSGTNYVKSFGKEILAGPNIPSNTPTALANFINNEWTNQLASQFAALAAAAGDITAAGITATPSATHAVKAAASKVSPHSAPAVIVPTAAASEAVSLALSEVHPAVIDNVLATIVPTDTDKKK